jgi:DNA polymerase-3 subunit alpha
MTPSFVHLRLHSEFSLIDGTVRIKPLVERLKKLNMPAVAITDEANLFAWVKLQKAAEGAGIKPIFGVDVWLATPFVEAPVRLCLLAKSYAGYRQLTQLISKAYRQHQSSGKPLVTWEDLQEHRDGLILLLGGVPGIIGQLLLKNHLQQAEQVLQQLLATFPDHVYLEAMRTNRADEERYLHFMIPLAAKLDCPIVATNDVRFLTAEAFDAHEVRVCINSGHTLDDPKRPRLYSEQQYLKSAEEMVACFADLPQALQNSVEIAKRCTLQLPLGVCYLPNYPIPHGHTIDTYLRYESEKGLQTRLAYLFPEGVSDAQAEPYWARLYVELDIIVQMGFPGYFLIVMDFIQWAKKNGVPVGPGRGSGAGSLVAYALGITDLDPLAYDLLFERFLNPERVSMPDFDIDFCMEGRDRVIDYVAQTYGRDAVSQIITFGTLAAKAVVRDVGRVLGKPYGFVDRIAKLVPFEIGMTLSKALEDEPQLKAAYDEDEEVREMLDRALQLEGLTRNVGKHAGGVVIAPGQLTDLVPLYCDAAGDNLVTQFDKDDVEQVGLVKFDFLGLRTLTIIDWALQNIVKNGKEPVDINRIALDDPATFALLESGETTAIFQLESRGMKDLIKRLKPNCFEDIVALVALFRPGPLQSGMVDDFINRKHGRAQVIYSHPDLESVLKNTYGVILYQEQVMQIAQVLAGYTLGEADMLRRAMGKKKPEEMAKQREAFLKGSAARDIPADQANGIFDLMEKFAGYGFNKSHSAAYALLSYQTAWLKCHYPAEFMAAVLSSDMDNTDKVVGFIEDCRQMKLVLRSPNVNCSDYKFLANAQEVIYGLGAIKGVGEAAIEAVVAARLAGPFRSLFDFCRRVDPKKMNRRCLDALCKAGALDELGADRATLMAHMDQAVQAADQTLKSQQAGLMDLFASVVPNEPSYAADVPAWSETERLKGEKETLGLYFSGHPINAHRAALAALIKHKLVDLKPTGRGQSILVAGLIVGVRTMKGRRGKMGFVSIDDQTAVMDVSIFNELLDQAQPYLIKDEVLVVEGEVSHDEYSGQMKLVARQVFSLPQAQAHFAKRLSVQINADHVSPQWVNWLSQTLQPVRHGHCRVVVDYRSQAADVTLRLGDDWKITPSADLLVTLQSQASVKKVEVAY